jgi:hypothetical protein
MHIDIYISECMLSAYFNRLQPWSEVWDAIAELAEIVGDAAPHGVRGPARGFGTCYPLGI